MSIFGKLLQTVGFPKRPAPAAPAPVPPRPAPIEVTDADFATLVLADPGLVVVDCWAEWCEPCGVMSAYVSFLAADYAGRMRVAALDVETNPATATGYNILGLPTLLFFRNGQEIARQVGVLPYEQLRQQVEDLLGDG